MEALATVEKAVDVLFHLHEQAEARGVTAIGRALGIPKSSTHRLLRALTRRGLLERDARGRYRPGIGLVSLALGALERDPATRAARPELEREAEALGETVFLVGARAGRLFVLDKVEGTGFLRAAPQVGATVPVHATAVGKLFVAFGALPRPGGALTRYTAHTKHDARAFERELGRVRRLGFAENREEWIPGLSVVAAPVLRGERMLAALAVAAPAARLRALGERPRERVLAAARRVAERLEGRSVEP